MNKDLKLKWLATNVHEWPETARSCYLDNGVITCRTEDIRGHFTREQWQAARDEMTGKPSWDEVPSWANWIAQSKKGHWECYAGKPVFDDEKWTYSSRGQCVGLAKYRGSVLGDWRDTLERRPCVSQSSESDKQEDLSVTDEKQWYGPEDGLPPINTIVEYNDCGKWVKTRVLGHHPDESNVLWHQAVDVEFSDGRSSSSDDISFFRALHTDEDKVVEEMMESGAIGAFYGAGGGAINDNAFEALFRQMFRTGYRKQEL